MGKIKIRRTGQWRESGYDPNTPPGGDTTAPELQGPITLVGVVGGFKISGTFNEVSTLEVQYGTTTAYGATASSTASLSPTRTVTGLFHETLYHVRWRAVDAALNATAWSTDLTVDTKATTDPSPFTHGDEIFRYNIGRADGYYAEDTRTPLAAPTLYTGSHTFTSAQSNTTWDNYEFASPVKFESNADNIRFTNCHFEFPATTGTQYGIHLAPGSNAIYFDDCTILGAAYDSKTIYRNSSTGGGGWFRRCLILGGEDCCHTSGNTGNIAFPDYVAEDFTGARMIFEDCFIGENTKAAGGHTDCLQIENDGGKIVVLRCKIMSYFMLQPNRPRDDEALEQDHGNAAIIMTYGATPGALSDVGIYDCRFNGGNNTVNLAPPDGPTPTNTHIRRCTWGAESPFSEQGFTVVASRRYQALVGGTQEDCTYAVTGTVWEARSATVADRFYEVVAGDPVV